ncbi:hypothetical protein ANCDUO_03183 [Ancylostoma duodenale]|uniref:Uncharacterized protein n=1 Tax=Ancylostoma duodenale TaxID=51022 RepID=A0A0C2D9R7_9BILA|nr:hypothetical protein ANCDUO_03183 [Ancylostoma duodenale]
MMVRHAVNYDKMLVRDAVNYDKMMVRHAVNCGKMMAQDAVNYGKMVSVVARCCHSRQDDVNHREFCSTFRSLSKCTHSCVWMW